MPRDQYDFEDPSGDGSGRNGDDTDSTPGGKRPRLRSASRSSLPIVSVIPDPETFQQARQLLAEGVALKAQASEIKERLEEIQADLAITASAYELRGFRHGLCGFEYRGYQTRKTLKKDKLVALLSRYGIPVTELEECYADGTPFLDARFVAFDLE